MKSTAEWVAAIQSALERNNTYNRALDFTIVTLANNLRANDLVARSLDTMESAILERESRYGHEPIEHPVFKTLKKTSDAVVSLCKQLGLTPEDLNTDIDEDPLVDITRQLTKVR